MDKIDKEVNEILKYIADRLRGLVFDGHDSTKKEIARSWGFKTSKNFCDFERYGREIEEGQQPNPLFRHTYRILHGILGRPPIFLEPIHKPVVIFAGQDIELPKYFEPDKYLAVPLVDGRIAAGMGRIIEENISNYVFINEGEIEARRNLVAVRLASTAESMEPTLNPGDIVIIDRDDKIISPKGIYAVRMEPEGCAIKRVRISKSNVWLLSDNSLLYPPEPAYTDDLNYLIIGRVIYSLRNYIRK